MEGEKYSLTRADKIKWLTNTALFAAPVVLIYLGSVQGNISDGFLWSDFIPSQFVVGSMVTYVISTAIDVIRKFVNGR